ncbi:MAG: T9SS type A sorting domain-containing protein [Crocinitomicaceae bacterium]|nr:T9SS type A sorting domain-containing protein [Crocinitomicaceae bacterium]
MIFSKKVTQLLKCLIVFISFTIHSQSLPDDIDVSVSSNGVVPLPSTVSNQYSSAGFVKYTKIACPNGEAIHFIAQNAISDAQIVRARTILNFYLQNKIGSQYGNDKSAVINTMGTNDATLLLMNGSDDGSNDPMVNGQPLYEEEMAVEGHNWYQTNNYDHRDASFEEILHMMHDMGIGVDGSNSISNPALPAYQTEIRNAQLNAHNNNFDIWPIGADGSIPDIQNWYNELDNENSLSQEYLASLIDAYYGLWDPWIEDPTTSMWGIYKAHNRAEIEAEDTMGWNLLPKFFEPYINVDMIIDPSFNGTFSLTLDQNSDYTLKSQYLQHVYLSGTNASSLMGNDQYNRLKGNNANNSFEGLKGHDRLDGQGGENTAIFTGVMADYTVTNLIDHAIVFDNTPNRDGADTLWNIQQLQFSDQTTPIDLTSTLTISHLSPISSLITYPNPCEDIIFIQHSDEVHPKDYQIISSNGKIVQSGIYSENGIKTMSLPSGHYYLFFNNKTDLFIKK